MPRPLGSDHVVLSDTQLATPLPSGTPVIVGLRLLRDKDGVLQYRWQLGPELVWEQKSWWNGGLVHSYNPQVPETYAMADGVWCATEKEVSLGPRFQPAAFGVRDGCAELNSLGGYWTQTGLTASVVTTAPFDGLYHFNLASVDATDIFSQAIPNPGRYSSRAIKFTFWARVASGSATVRANTVEAPAATTNGTGVALTTTYQRVTVSATMGNNLTSLTVQFECTVGTAVTVYVDQMTIEDTADATLSIQSPFFEMAGSLGCVTLNAVWLWDDTDDYWVIQTFQGSNITGHRVWDNRLFLAHGASTAYEYSGAAAITDTSADSGINANWTASTAADANAQFFALGRTGFSAAMALYKTLDPDNLKTSPNPVNAGTAWSAQIEVGFNDRSITGAYEAFGTVYAGKEDGIYAAATTDFITNYEGTVNVAPDLLYQAGDVPFARGLFYKGWFYTIINEQGLWRYNGAGVWQDLSDLVATPGFTEFGGKIDAFGTDGKWLYVIVQDRAAAATSKESWVLALREHSEGWEIHPLRKLRMNRCYGMGYLANSSGNFLFIQGDISSQPVSYRIWLGSKAATPRLATNNGLELQGDFITSYLEVPEPVAGGQLVVFADGLTANLTITAAYMQDDETSWTSFSTAFDDTAGRTSPGGVIAIPTAVKPKERVRFRLRFVSNSLTSTPVLKGFRVHLKRLREWTLVAGIEDGIYNLAGGKAVLPAAKAISALDTLRASVAVGLPLYFYDLDGTEQRGRITEMGESLFQVREVQAGVPRYARGVQIVVREVVV